MTEFRLKSDVHVFRLLIANSAILTIMHALKCAYAPTLWSTVMHWAIAVLFMLITRMFWHDLAETKDLLAAMLVEKALAKRVKELHDSRDEG